MKEAPPRRAAFAIGIVLVAGCAGIEHAPQQQAPAATPAGAVVPAEPRGAPAETPSEPPHSEPAKGGIVASAPAIRPAGPARAAPTGGNPAKPAPSTPPSTPPAPAKVAASPPPAALPVKTQTPAPTAVMPAAQPPALDLKSLETQLKATKAIGVFTKLTLKNQIDELLGRFRAFHQGEIKTSLAELRRSFDMLVMKTLALLQDADPSLAGALASSRESIWGILSDPAKFAKV